MMPRRREEASPSEVEEDFNHKETDEDDYDYDYEEEAQAQAQLKRHPRHQRKSPYTSYKCLKKKERRALLQEITVQHRAIHQWANMGFCTVIWLSSLAFTLLLFLLLRFWLPRTKLERYPFWFMLCLNGLCALSGLLSAAFSLWLQRNPEKTLTNLIKGADRLIIWRRGDYYSACDQDRRAPLRAHGGSGGGEEEEEREQEKGKEKTKKGGGRGGGGGGSSGGGAMDQWRRFCRREWSVLSPCGRQMRRGLRVFLPGLTVALIHTFLFGSLTMLFHFQLEDNRKKISLVVLTGVLHPPLITFFLAYTFHTYLLSKLCQAANSPAVPFSVIFAKGGFVFGPFHYSVPPSSMVDMASSMLSPSSSASSSSSAVLTSSAIKLPPLTWKLQKVESVIVPSSSSSSSSSSMYSLPRAMKEKGHDYSVVKNNIDEEEQSISEHNERDERQEVEGKVLQERELRLTFTLDYLCKRLRRDVHVPIPPGREKDVPKIRALLLGSSSIEDELA